MTGAHIFWMAVGAILGMLFVAMYLLLGSQECILFESSMICGFEIGG